MTVTQIAKIAHEIRSVSIGLFKGKPTIAWDDLNEGVKNYILREVHYWLKNPSASASDSHNEWLRCKTEEGWSFGEENDHENKKHPSIVPYDQIPIQEKMANELIMKTVRLLSEFIVE